MTLLRHEFPALGVETYFRLVDTLAEISPGKNNGSLD